MAWAATLLLQPLQKVASTHLPNTHALVQRTSGEVAVVWGNGNGGDAVLDCEADNALITRNIPHANGPVAGSGGDEPAIRGVVQAVDVLLVASELVADGTGRDVPDLIFGQRHLKRLHLLLRTLMILSSAPVAR